MAWPVRVTTGSVGIESAEAIDGGGEICLASEAMFAAEPVRRE